MVVVLYWLTNITWAVKIIIPGAHLRPMEVRSLSSSKSASNTVPMMEMSDEVKNTA
jgi:hypothetical protein